MATLRNKRKLAALNKENCEEHPRSNLAQTSSAPRSQEDYITQVPEEIEGRVTKLSQELSRTEDRILGAQSHLDDFLLILLIQGHSWTAPEASRKACDSNQGTNEDDYQSDPHPEASISQGHMTQSCGPEETHDISNWTNFRKWIFEHRIFIPLHLHLWQTWHQPRWSKWKQVISVKESKTDLLYAVMNIFVYIKDFTVNDSERLEELI